MRAACDGRRVHRPATAEASLIVSADHVAPSWPRGTSTRRAWFTHGSLEFDASIADMVWPHDDPKANRGRMMADEAELVEVLHTLRQVLNDKET